MPSTLLTWLRRTAILGLVAFPLVTVLDYVIGTNSDAMRAARDAIERSERIRQQVGIVESVNLDKFWGFGRQSAYGGDRADLSLQVEGSQGRVALKVCLEERGETWHVVSTSEPL